MLHLTAADDTFRFFTSWSHLGRGDAVWSCRSSLAVVIPTVSFLYLQLNGLVKSPLGCCSWEPRITLRDCPQPWNVSSNVPAVALTQSPTHSDPLWQEVAVSVTHGCGHRGHADPLSLHTKSGRCHMATGYRLIKTIPAPSPRHLSTLWTCQAAREVGQERSVLLKCCWCRGASVGSSSSSSPLLSSYIRQPAYNLISLLTPISQHSHTSF